MRQRWINLIFGVVILILTIFIIVDSTNYEEFDGLIGQGHKVGFSLTIKTMIAVLVIILSIPLYFVIKKKK